MPYKNFLFAVFFIIVAAISFPIFQMVTSSGYVFYCNGVDEGSYLQYDFAKLSTKFWGLSRVSQRIVVALHELGFSGGMINFLFDLIIPGVVFFLTYFVFIKFAFEKRHAYVASILVVVLPVFFTAFNPFLSYLAEANRHTSLNFWVTTPDTDMLPLFRTPEPQFSFLLIALTMTVSLLSGRLWLNYLVTPFLYPFIAVPFAFILLSIHLRVLFAKFGLKVFFSPVISYLLISTGLFFYNNFILNDDQRSYLVATHLPLVSVTGVIALIIYSALSSAFHCKNYISLVFALAPNVAANTQIISGWLVQANNYEQYAGAICISCILAMHAPKFSDFFNRNLARVALGIVLLLGVKDFATNRAITGEIQLTESVLQQLRQAPQELALNDVKTSTWLNLVYPRQAPLLFSITNTYGALVNQYLPNYLCAKKIINSKDEWKLPFKITLEFMDEAYAWGHTTYVLNTNSRKVAINSLWNVGQVPENCPPLRLKTLLLSGSLQH